MSVVNRRLGRRANLGQKANPIGMRVAVTKNWRSRWFSAKKNFGALLNEDVKVKKLVSKRLENAAVADIVIERYANRIRVNIYTARPGIVVGRKGQDIERIKSDLVKLTGGKEVYIEIREVRDPDLNANLVAENIALQIERRVSTKRAIKRALKLAMDLGALGIRVKCSGRLGGAEIARDEWYKEGSVPLHTLKANIDYGFAEAATPAGRIGIKVWICRKAETSETAQKRGRK